MGRWGVITNDLCSIYSLTKLHWHLLLKEKPTRLAWYETQTKNLPKQTCSSWKYYITQTHIFCYFAIFIDKYIYTSSSQLTYRGPSPPLINNWGPFIIITAVIPTTHNTDEEYVLLSKNGIQSDKKKKKHINTSHASNP